MKKQQGFTLIELIIVIVILGILAVTAAPKFFDFSSDARKSTLAGLKGAIEGAVSIEYARSAVQGSPIYPEPVAAGQANSIVDALQIDTGDWVITPGAGKITFSAKEGSVAKANCHIEYSYISSLPAPPTVTLTDSGC